AARLQRAENFNQQRDAFHRSHEGVEAAREAYSRLVNGLKSNSELLSSIGCRIQDVAYGGITMIVGHSVVLTVQFEFFSANSLDKAALTAGFYDGVPRLPSLMVLNEPRTLKKWKFKFGLVGPPDRTGWTGPDGKEHAPEALAEFLLGHFLELRRRQLGQAE